MLGSLITLNIQLECRGRRKRLAAKCQVLHAHANSVHMTGLFNLSLSLSLSRSLYKPGLLYVTHPHLFLARYPLGTTPLFSRLLEILPPSSQMAQFPCQNTPFLLDSVILPNTPIKMPGLLEKEATNTTCFPYYYPPEPLHEVPNPVRVGKESSLDNSRKLTFTDNELAVIERHNTDSSSAVIEAEIGNQVTQKKTGMEKRKNRNGSCLISTQSMDANQGKVKKQRRCKSTLKDTKEKQLKAEKKVAEGTQTAYIHVRARRGQATDSHSLAERVRREKISERMKLLESLVPGCDKVSGKALMLEEIINYVLSLQNQVEFLSMKLSSVSAMFSDFGVDLDALMLPDGFLASNMKFQKVGNLALPSPFIQVSSPTQPSVFVDDTNTFTTTNNYPILDSSVSMLVQQELKPNAFYQDNEYLLWGTEDERTRFTNQSWSNNFYSF